MSLLRLPWRVLRALALGGAALLFWFEEFGWRPLAAALGRLAQWGPWRRVEARIATLPPRPALALFLIPALGLLPIKLLAVHLLGAGRPWLGLSVIVAAKLVGTALGGRLFVLMRPQLMTLRGFSRAVARWCWLRLRVRRALRASAAWRAVRRGAQRVRAHWQALRRGRSAPRR